MKKVVCIAIHRNATFESVAIFDDSKDRIARIYGKEVAKNLRIARTGGKVLSWKAEIIEG